MRTGVQRRRAFAAGLALAGALGSGCGSSGVVTSPEETFRVGAPGERHDVIVGAAAAGRFRFEARGFAPAAVATPCDALPVFFMLWDGVPDSAATLFRYQLMQARGAGACTGIAVRGYHPEYPSGVFAEECASFAWEPARWYRFEVVWGGETIRTHLDGELVFEGSYVDNRAPLIASLGGPPTLSCGSTSATGIEYRRWALERP